MFEYSREEGHCAKSLQFISEMENSMNRQDLALFSLHPLQAKRACFKSCSCGQLCTTVSETVRSVEIPARETGSIHLLLADQG